MSVSHGMKKIVEHNRAPRLQIEYDIEVHGANKTVEKVELPFVMGVLADLSGKPIEALPPVSQRTFIDVDLENFDQWMKTIGPRVAFTVPNTLSEGVQLRFEMSFESIDDFSPTAVARRVDSLSHLLDARTQLAKQTAVQRLAEQPGQQPNTLCHDADKSIEATIAEMDRKLSNQINLILHHSEFQKLESAWRGAYHLVSNTETDEKLKIRFMDVSKDELRRTMRRYKGLAWKRSPLFKKVYEEKYGQVAGEPYGCLIADYYFDHTPPDVDLLGALAKLAAAAHAPIISGASASLLEMESWQELTHSHDLTQIFTQHRQYASWNSLRNTECARYVGLAMPRFLARLPYGAKTKPVDEFDFEEDANGDDHRQRAWINAAYAMGVNINRSFKLYGWGSPIGGIESGGTVEDGPCHTFSTDGGAVDVACLTEIAISSRREAELTRSGFIPLIRRKNTAHATFVTAQAQQKAAEVHGACDAATTANANASARLTQMFACSRFAHYLKCIVRDEFGTLKGREDMQSWLNEWIMNYVDADSAHSSQETKARRPLAAAAVTLEDVEGKPGYYRAKLVVRPHFQLEGLTISLRLVAKRSPIKEAA
ncbi:type VI secretion system contractile sheath large subunit [Burkholderia sp. L27(2015)]|uniref:type VI secretion system contractile sheath large subunit n=1 Tax=Burkholderia sp. L27(2015) TaxID=1641858 RepID=UPI0015767D46|nr:type VI secretion system contractile sheath large subunit [Burkholderia sp. L27(2015)]